MEIFAYTSLHLPEAVRGRFTSEINQSFSKSAITDDILDALLDQEGLEVDPVDRLEGDTPLHTAVRYVNGLSKEEWEAGSSIPELLLDAGADPRFVPCPTTEGSG